MVTRPNPDSNHPPERYYDHRSGRMRRTGQGRMTPRSPNLHPLPPSPPPRKRSAWGHLWRFFVTLVLALLVGLGAYVMYEAGYLDRLALDPASPESPPIGTAIAVPTPMPTIGSLPEARQYMLEQINRERASSGLNPVGLGSNRAAQIDAEATLEGCFGSHWGLDGGIMSSMTACHRWWTERLPCQAA